MAGCRHFLCVASIATAVGAATGLAIQAEPAQPQGGQSARASAADAANVGILHVRGNVYMVNLGDVNVTWEARIES